MSDNSIIIYFYSECSVCFVFTPLGLKLMHRIINFLCLYANIIWELSRFKVNIQEHITSGADIVSSCAAL